jgi:asparagine synthase (glutamine-hydrolysing)
MCGIAGIVSLESEILSSELEKMTESLRSRGPDYGATWLSKNKKVGLGHRRLSIIDLSEKGNQPMIVDDRYSIVFNGEIYNFRSLRNELIKKGINFFSQTDTEVVLKAYIFWGPSFTEKLDGMYSFCIYDAYEENIFLARDIFGIKPLYIYQTNNKIVFASRPIAIYHVVKSSISIDTLSAKIFLDMGYIPAPRSMHKEIKKILPGETVLLNISGDKFTEISRNKETFLSKKNLEDEIFSSKMSYKDCKKIIHSNIIESVEAQMYADVDVGVFLSGGLDSSLVAAIMQKLSDKPIDTFTISFLGDDEDESAYATKISKYLGTRHHQINFTHKDLINYIEKSSIEFDEPLADCASLPGLMLSDFASKHVKVCMGGDGGDELFLGYKNYYYTDLFSKILVLPQPLRKFFWHLLSFLFKSSHNKELFKKAFLSYSPSEIFYLTRTIDKFGYFNQKNNESSYIFEIINDVFKNNTNFLPSIAASEFDLMSYMIDDILQKVDVTSMAYSLEVRVPLLAKKVVRSIYNLPKKFKYPGVKSKFILRDIASIYYPSEFHNRKKKGFNVPIKNWFRGDLKEYIFDTVNSNFLEKFGIFNSKINLIKVFEDHVSKKRDNQNLLWGILSLKKWSDKYL